MYVSIKRAEILLALFFVLLIISCTDKNPKYLHKILDVDEYDLINMNNYDQNGKFLSADLWYDPSNSEDYFLSSIGCLEEVGNSVWICDPLKGELLSYSENGKFIKKILTKGKGPLEVIYPSASFVNDFESLIYIYDSGQRKLIGITKNGDIEQVVRSKFFPSGVFDNTFKTSDKNSFYWNTFSKKEYSLHEWDSLGNQKRGLVKRIIPLGFNPVTHNNVTFDVGKDLFVYAYKGLPLVFLKNGDCIKVVNLLPNIELEEINIGLTPIPLESPKMTSVKNLIRSIYIVNSKVYINYLSSLLLYDPKMGSIKKFEFIDSDKNEIKFHRMYLTDNYIYICNLYNLKIFRIGVKDLS